MADFGTTADGFTNALSSSGVNYLSTGIPGDSPIGGPGTQTILNSQIPSLANLSSSSSSGSFLDSVKGLITPSASSSGAASSSFWTDLFLRAVIIILGFIFMAVGLTMFKSDNQ